MTTALDIAVPEDVLAEEERCSAQVEFDSFFEAVRDFFPDALYSEIRLLADPDEDDRNWIVFEVRIARDTPQGAMLRQDEEFNSGLERRRPHVPWPICVLHLRYAKE